MSPKSNPKRQVSGGALPEVLWTVLGVGMVAATAAFIGWAMVRALKRTQDPPRLIVRWILTGLVAGVLVWTVAGGAGLGMAFVAPLVCVVLGIMLSIIWAPSIGAALARPLTALFDGGIEEAKPEPFYSVARAKRNKGQYQEALWDIQQQLEKFPNDYAGQVLMAEIQANDLKDLQAAQATIARLCQQPGHSPAALADALNQLADWHLKYAQDTEAARQAIEQIVQLLPDTSWAYAATQRLAHLAGTAQLLGPHDRQPVPLPHATDDGDWPRRAPVAAPPGPPPETEAQELVNHLEKFPEDNEAREQLAMRYAHHYQRLDLAAAELEQLIAQPHAPARKVAAWLNLLADWQLELGRDEEGARQTLQRIIDLFPDQGPAEMARQRMDGLKRALKKTEATTAVKLGTYEQDLGLKIRRPVSELTTERHPPASGERTRPGPPSPGLTGGSRAG